MKRSGAEKIARHGAALWEACALIAGVRLDVFAALRRGSLTAAVLARRCRCSLRGMRALADALAAHGYLSFRKGRYGTTPLSRRHLLPGGKEYLGDALLHQGRMLEGWSQLDAVVRRGKPVGGRPKTPIFIRAMASNANLTAPVLTKMIPLKGARTLLDLGGGPGIHSVHFCRRNPRLRATLFDLPETLRVARKILAPHPEASRIKLHRGDAVTDPLPGPFDVVWISHLIHSMSDDEARRVLAKAARALKPGGRLVLHEFFSHEGRPGPPFAALFRLNMLRGTAAGRTWSREELKRLLRRLGLGRFKDAVVPPRGVSGLILASRP